MFTDANIHFFLGANTPSGFYSLYDELHFSAAEGMLYILKGGPGCGKSSLLKTVASQLTENGYSVEHIHCSADPDSLDGIIVPSLHIAIADGTAPHVIEPRYPAVSELYIDLSAYYDADAIGKLGREIIDITKQYQALYSRAYRVLAAAGSLTQELISTVESEPFLKKAEKRSRGIISREIPRPNGRTGRIYERFLSTVCYGGETVFWETVESSCSRVYELCDGFHLAHRIIEPIAAAAVKSGLDVVLCRCPYAPERYEHLIIPALKLAFVSSGARLPYPGIPYRRLRLERMSETAKSPWAKNLVRSIRSIVRDATGVLAQTKTLHDELEAYYNPHVDFPGVYKRAAELAAALVSEPR